MADASPTLGWSIPNLITVTAMVVLTFAIAGFAYRLFRSATMPKVQPAPDGETGPLS